MNNIIAVGPRELDFENTNGFFSGSITLYGSGENGNISYCRNCGKRINHNVISEDQTEFVAAEIARKIEEDPTVRFMSYDPNQVFDCGEACVSHTLCLNSQSLMEKLNHKVSFRQWVAPVCRVHHSDLLSGSACTYKMLTERYPGHSEFVIQADFACGGEGTLLMSARNAKEIESALLLKAHYLVSPYIWNNVPVNFHAIIYPEEVLLFPPSIQIMCINGNKLLYQGGDFPAAEQADSQAMNKFRQAMLDICEKLRKEGYLGITGVDGMLVDGEVYILEMNNRFQGSTALLNFALQDRGLPSVQELNYEAFTQKRASISLEGFSVPYSCYTYLFSGDRNHHSRHIQRFKADPNVAAVQDDGLSYAQPIAPLASLERITFRTNIVSVTSEGRVALHPNIPDMDPAWVNRIVEQQDLLYLKIALVNQGLWFSEDAEQYLSSHGGIREGVYNAVDITIGDITINAAVHIKFSKLSPFSLELCDGRLTLCCYGRPVSPADVQPVDPLLDISLSEQSKVRDICLLATDRVRIQHSTSCFYKRCRSGCKFCEVDDHEYSFCREDVFRAIDHYLRSDHAFRHFLVGGRSGSPTQEPDEILDIVRYIRSQGDWPIYVMCVPPQNLETLREFKDAGVTELAMNLEIWDAGLARHWMPGKGLIPRERYLEALEFASELWGRTGSVRSAFVVGLESEDSLLEGIRCVCQAGAAPILSIFRPIPGTAGNIIVPPENHQLLSVYEKAVSICLEYGLAPGPTCVPCQNNTLSMPSGTRLKRGCTL